jgi:hypothetical protein
VAFSGPPLSLSLPFRLVIVGSGVRLRKHRKAVIRLVVSDASSKCCGSHMSALAWVKKWEDSSSAVGLFGFATWFR